MKSIARVSTKKPETLLGCRLRDLRMSLGLALIQVADVIGIRPQTLSGYELGKINPSKKSIAKLEEFYGVNISMELSERVLASKGRWITVKFEKLDGSTRVLNGRLGVVKHLRGGQRTSNPDEYLILWDAEAKGYRHIHKSRIMYVKDQGVEYT